MTVELFALARAARPGLFDCVRNPELMTVLIVANLMSPALWTLADKIRSRISTQNHQTDCAAKHALILEALNFVNHHFTHLLASDLVELVGTINLDDERSWNSADIIDTAIDELLEEIARRDALGVIKPKANTIPFIRRNEFPNYCYLTIEGMIAERLVARKKFRRTTGLSICADEITLVAALLCILGLVDLREFAILGAPHHYSLLIFGEGDHRFWANGKREFFDEASWHTLVLDNPPADPQRQFDRRLNTTERIITPYGYALLRERKNTLSREAAHMITSAASAFLGVSLRQLAPLEEADFPSGADDSTHDPFADLHNNRDATEVGRKVKKKAVAEPGSIFEQALYCAREIAVSEPNAYLIASLRGPKLRETARNVHSFEDACNVVAAIKGDVSSRENPDHICLPDEVLLFNTGDHRDKALLLLTLLVASPTLHDKAMLAASLQFSKTSAYVFWNDEAFDLARWCFTNVSAPPVVTISPNKSTKAISWALPE